MDLQRQNFLTAVLGTEGATMLVKAVEKHDVLEHALLPRTILAWLQSAPSYEGALPGNNGTHVNFEKSESGFTGSVGMGADLYKFEAVSVFHVGAAVAVALGVEELVSDGLRDLDIERLGKTIDSLAKVKRVNDELDEEKDDEEKDAADADALDKAAGTGVPAAPTPPTPPAAPAAAAPKTPAPSVAPKVPKPPKTASMTLQRSEAGHKCPACGGTQFKDDAFVGCICFRAMNKAIKVASADADALTIEMDMRILDADDVATFREALGR
jgi:hypothetical protein